MLKKTCAILLFVMGITTIGLGTVNEVRAEENPIPCTNFTITLQSVDKRVGDNDIFDYSYDVTAGDIDISKIDHLYFGIDANLEVIPNNNVAVAPLGVGATKDGWLEGVPHLQVITIAAHEYIEETPLIISVSGSNGDSGYVATHTTAGKDIEACLIEVGPVIGLPVLPVDVSVLDQKRVKLYGKDYPTSDPEEAEFCIDIDQRTGCPKLDITGFPVVYKCDDINLPLEQRFILPIDENFVLGTALLPENDGGPATPTIVHGEGSDPRCPVSKVAHNPCQWICIGGTCYGAYCW